MEFANYFPIWSELTPAHQDLISRVVIRRTISQGTVIRNGSLDKRVAAFLLE